MSDGFADCLRNGHAALLAAAGLRELLHIALCFDNNFGHHGHGLAGIKPGGGFGGKHHGVGAVENSVGDVAGLGACGARVFDHGLEHLSSCDDRLSPFRGAANHMFLNYWDSFRRQLYAEVAAGYHHAIGCFENFFELIECLGLFQFGDHGNSTVVSRDDLLGSSDIGGGTHERESYYVDAVFKTKFKVLAVFGSKRRNGKGGAGQVNTLVLAEKAAVDDLTFDLGSTDAHDTEFDQAVGEQNAGIGANFLGQGGKSRGDQA